jgi:hypothetical protein
MLLVTFNQTITGRLIALLLHKVNHKTCSTLTWPISMGLMNTLRYTGIALTLSTTMPGLLLPVISLPRHRSPYPCTDLTLSTYTYLTRLSRRRLSWLTTQLSTLWLALAVLKPSSMNDLTTVLSPMAQLRKSSGSSRSSTCASPIHKLP